MEQWERYQVKAEILREIAQALNELGSVGPADDRFKHLATNLTKRADQLSQRALTAVKMGIPA